MAKKAKKFKITPKIEVGYIESPYHCPKCGSQDISSGDFDHEGLVRDVDCHGCGFEWQEYMKIVGINERE